MPSLTRQVQKKGGIKFSLGLETPNNINRLVEISKVVHVILFSMLLALFNNGCTSVGTHDYRSLNSNNFGEVEDLRVCLLLDDRHINEKQAMSLMAKVAVEFMPYKIRLSVPWIRHWDRTAIFNKGIFENVAHQTIEPPCDRLFVFVGRNFIDFAFGLTGIEILGAVDTATHTRGFVVAEKA